MTTTLHTALQSFMLANRAEGKSLKTQRSYKDILDDFVEFTGDIPVDTITPTHIRGYIAVVTSRPGIHRTMTSNSVKSVLQRCPYIATVDV